MKCRLFPQLGCVCLLGTIIHHILNWSQAVATSYCSWSGHIHTCSWDMCQQFILILTFHINYPFLGACNVAHSLVRLPSMDEALYSTLSRYKLGVVEHTWNPITWEVVAKGLWVQGHCWLLSKFEVSLEYERPHLKKESISFLLIC